MHIRQILTIALLMASSLDTSRADQMAAVDADLAEDDEYVYEKGYAGLVVSVKKQLLSEVKNRMLELVINQHFIRGII